MAIYLLRHGESVGNVERYYQGRLDQPLTQRGIAQARTLGGFLRSLELREVAVYTSPLSRALETARIAAQAAGWAAPAVEPLIVEYDAGTLQGLTVEQVAAAWPGYADRPLEARGDYSEFGGESYAAVQVRLAQFIERIEAQYPAAADVAAFLHGGSLYQLVKLWCGYPVPQHFFTRIGNCCCYKLERREVAGVKFGELQWMLTVELMERMAAPGPALEHVAQSEAV